MKTLLIVLLLVSSYGYSQSFKLNDKDTCFWLKIDITKISEVKAMFDDYKIIHHFVFTEIKTGDTLYVFDYNMWAAEWYIYRDGKLIRIKENRFLECENNLFFENLNYPMD